ncbi:restriction endonuclease [Paenibacillus dendritiformis C454]|uniref:Restriction endonuclease n=1 Tax=Paenibacillus dendritiformis C454 TaxID=1131935 RepID=H3SM26_9BACL|nr:restriction endonuclease [Paenibacillus dendritiformis]EHQ59876.1 restriction endonuclease [Paenibacillus dendritiformis C454]
MAIPDFQSIMLPFLIQVSDEQEHRHRDTRESLAKHFRLTDEELDEKLPSGRQTIFDNRVGWARTYLMKAGLLEYPRRGYCKITTKGRDVLKSNPSIINISFLRQFPEFLEFHTAKNNDDQKSDEQPLHSEQRTPGENLEYSYLVLRKELAFELLQRLKAGSPQFFEKSVVELLVKMGYGGSISDAGKAVGKSRDGGIDGIIKEDRLGLDMIYIQAKRWEGVVGRPEIQKFVGALQGQKARKGVFITTSGFTKEAVEYVTFIDNKVVLIDGEQLTQLMIDYNLGVSTVAVYEEKRIDLDFFSED